MGKVNFRIKLNNDKRAVSYRNIEVEDNNGVTYVTFNGVKTMVRQYLNSIYKKYKFRPKFKKEYGNALVVRFDSMPEDIYKDLSQKLTQFARGYMFKSNNTNLDNISFKVELLGVRVDNFTTPTSSAPAPVSTQSNTLIQVKSIKVRDVDGNYLLKSWKELQHHLYNLQQLMFVEVDNINIRVKWENDKEIDVDMDISRDLNKSEFDSDTQFIGEVLKNIAFKNDGKIVENYDWGIKNNSSQNQSAPAPQQQPQTQMPQNTVTLNLIGHTNYVLTESQLETIYGANWREVTKEKLDWIDELDFKLGTIINENQAMQLIQYGNFVVEIDGLDYAIYVEATTLACYKDYNDLSAEEIDEIIDGLKVFTEIGFGVSEERKNAYELMENLKLFKKHNK